MEDEKEELKKRMGQYASENGFRLNPDEKIMDRTLGGLLRNKDKYGEIYCPCRIRTGDKEKDRPIICPCVFHRDELEKDGHCHCMLFTK